MKYLTPYIEKLAKKASEKSLAKQGVSCGIFQDLDVNLGTKKSRQNYHVISK